MKNGVVKMALLSSLSGRFLLILELSVVLSSVAILSVSGADAFDLQKQSYFEAFFPYQLKVLRDGVSQSGDAVTILFYVSTLVSVAQFDALSPYHPTSEGILAKLRKRPYSERTVRNKNIAAIFAGVRLLSKLVPSQRQTLQALMWKLRLDPDDIEENDKTPQGIGNLVARLILDSCVNDGMNMKGNWDFGGNLRSANLRPFKDYTGYTPMNGPLKLDNPERWQPLEFPVYPGVYSAQQFLTPQMRLVTPFTFENPADFTVIDHLRVPIIPQNIIGPTPDRFAQYKKSVRDLLYFSSELTEAQKVVSEFFDDKIRSVFASTYHIAILKKLSPDEFSQLSLTSNLAVFDALIVAWQLKTRWDAVRPFSAIPFAMEKRLVPSYIRSNRTFGMVASDEWTSYLPMPNYPEYPSGTSSVCFAHAEAMRRSLGTDGLKWSVPVNQGSSKIEPGITPEKNMTLSFYTWSEWERICGFSRLYGGLNFPDSIENVREMAQQMGRRAIEFVRYHVNLNQGGTGSGSSQNQNSEQPYLILNRDRSQYGQYGGSSNSDNNAKKKREGTNFSYHLIFDP